jgi:basic membrane protein A
MTAVIAASSVLCTACGGVEPDQPIVRVLYPVGGLGDRSFSDMVYTGIVRAELGSPFEKIQAAPADLADAEKIMKEWISGGIPHPGLVVTVGQTYTAALKSIGCPSGEVRLLHLDDTLPPCPNIISVTYRTYAPSFLAGVAAMAVSKRKTAAILGGMDLPTVNEFMKGFAAGVAYAGGSVVASEYLAADESGFNAPEKARERAESLFVDADVVFPVAGASGGGVFEAAKAAADRYAIGVDTDQSWLGRHVIIGSVVKRLDSSVENTVRAFLCGSFSGGRVSPGLDDGGTEFAVNDIFSAQVLAPVEAAHQAAIDAERGYGGASR